MSHKQLSLEFIDHYEAVRKSRFIRSETRCRPFGGYRCVLTCDDDTVPTHCPATDSMKPYATWKGLRKCICGQEAVDGDHYVDCAKDLKDYHQQIKAEDEENLLIKLGEHNQWDIDRGLAKLSKRWHDGENT